MVLSTATCYEFFRVQPNCKTSAFVYIFLKRNKLINVIKFSNDNQQPTESSNLPWPSARSFMHHCQLALLVVRKETTWWPLTRTCTNACLVHNGGQSCRMCAYERTVKCTLLCRTESALESTLVTLVPMSW